MLSWLDLLKSVALGILQGITEWLPVSSTGHLILLQSLLKMNVSPAFWEMFLTVIQLGSILAVVVLYFPRLWPFWLGDPARTRQTLSLWGKVLLATLPSGLAGFLLDDWIDRTLYTPAVVAVALILYGLAYIFMERCPRHTSDTKKAVSCETLPIKTALTVGVFQTLALVPGTSRSGSTILGAILLGLSRTTAAEFSFFMAVPTMLGAGTLRTVKFLTQNHAPLTGKEGLILLAGTLTAFLVSLTVIRFLTDFVKKHTFAPFGWYRVLLGLIVLACTAGGLL